MRDSALDNGHYLTRQERSCRRKVPAVKRNRPLRKCVSVARYEETNVAANKVEDNSDEQEDAIPIEDTDRDEAVDKSTTVSEHSDEVSHSKPLVSSQCKLLPAVTSVVVSPVISSCSPTCTTSSSTGTNIPTSVSTSIESNLESNFSTSSLSTFVTSSTPVYSACVKPCFNAPSTSIPSSSSCPNANILHSSPPVTVVSTNTKATSSSIVSTFISPTIPSFVSKNSSSKDLVCTNLSKSKVTPTQSGHCLLTAPKSSQIVMSASITSVPSVSSSNKPVEGCVTVVTSHSSDNANKSSSNMPLPVQSATSSGAISLSRSRSHCVSSASLDVTSCHPVNDSKKHTSSSESITNHSYKALSKYDSISDSVQISSFNIARQISSTVLLNSNSFNSEPSIDFLGLPYTAVITEENIPFTKDINSSPALFFPNHDLAQLQHHTNVAIPCETLSPSIVDNIINNNHIVSKINDRKTESNNIPAVQASVSSLSPAALNCTSTTNAIVSTRVSVVPINIAQSRSISDAETDDTKVCLDSKLSLGSQQITSFENHSIDTNRSDLPVVGSNSSNSTPFSTASVTTLSQSVPSLCPKKPTTPIFSTTLPGVSSSITSCLPIPCLSPSASFGISPLPNKCSTPISLSFPTPLPLPSISSALHDFYSFHNCSPYETKHNKSSSNKNCNEKMPLPVRADVDIKDSKTFIPLTQALMSSTNSSNDNNTGQCSKSTPVDVKCESSVGAVTDLLKCSLCRGYLVDATTIVVCLHTFCRSCIVRYLEHSVFCPECEVLLHNTSPLSKLKPDHAKQALLYTALPQLYYDEIRARRQFCDSSVDHNTVSLPDPGSCCSVLLPSDVICVQLVPADQGNKVLRYLQCSLAISVKNIKHFLKNKFNLETKQEIAVMIPDLIKYKKNVKFREVLESIKTSHEEADHLNLIKAYYSKVSTENSSLNVEGGSTVAQEYSSPNPVETDSVTNYPAVLLLDHETLRDAACMMHWTQEKPMKIFYKIFESFKLKDLKCSLREYVSSNPLSIPQHLIDGDNLKSCCKDKFEMLDNTFQQSLNRQPAIKCDNEAVVISSEHLANSINIEGHSKIELPEVDVPPMDEPNVAKSIEEKTDLCRGSNDDDKSFNLAKKPPKPCVQTKPKSRKSGIKQNRQLLSKANKYKSASKIDNLVPIPTKSSITASLKSFSNSIYASSSAANGVSIKPLGAKNDLNSSSFVLSALSHQQLLLMQQTQQLSQIQQLSQVQHLYSVQQNNSAAANINANDRMVQTASALDGSSNSVMDLSSPFSFIINGGVSNVANLAPLCNNSNLLYAAGSATSSVNAAGLSALNLGGYGLVPFITSTTISSDGIAGTPSLNTANAMSDSLMLGGIGFTNALNVQSTLGLQGAALLPYGLSLSPGLMCVGGPVAPAVSSLHTTSVNNQEPPNAIMQVTSSSTAADSNLSNTLHNASIDEKSGSSNTSSAIGTSLMPVLSQNTLSYSLSATKPTLPLMESSLKHAPAVSLASQSISEADLSSGTNKGKDVIALRSNDEQSNPSNNRACVTSSSKQGEEKTEGEWREVQLKISECGVMSVSAEGENDFMEGLLSKVESETSDLLSSIENDSVSQQSSAEESSPLVMDEGASDSHSDNSKGSTSLGAVTSNNSSIQNCIKSLHSSAVPDLCTPDQSSPTSFIEKSHQTDINSVISGKKTRGIEACKAGIKKPTSSKSIVSEGHSLTTSDDVKSMYSLDKNESNDAKRPAKIDTDMHVMNSIKDDNSSVKTINMNNSLKNSNLSEKDPKKSPGNFTSKLAPSLISEVKVPSQSLPVVSDVPDKRCVNLPSDSPKRKGMTSDVETVPKKLCLGKKSDDLKRKADTEDNISMKKTKMDTSDSVCKFTSKTEISPNSFLEGKCILNRKTSKLKEIAEKQKMLCKNNNSAENSSKTDLRKMSGKLGTTNDRVPCNLSASALASIKHMDLSGLTKADTQNKNVGKRSNTPGYKTLNTSPKGWNLTISRELLQLRANSSNQPKTNKFFKARNAPRSFSPLSLMSSTMQELKVEPTTKLKNTNDKNNKCENSKDSDNDSKLLLKKKTRVGMPSSKSVKVPQTQLTISKNSNLHKPGASDKSPNINESRSMNSSIKVLESGAEQENESNKPELPYKSKCEVVTNDSKDSSSQDSSPIKSNSQQKMQADTSKELAAKNINSPVRKSKVESSGDTASKSEKVATPLKQSLCKPKTLAVSSTSSVVSTCINVSQNRSNEFTPNCSSQNLNVKSQTKSRTRMTSKSTPPVSSSPSVIPSEPSLVASTSAFSECADEVDLVSRSPSSTKSASNPKHGAKDSVCMSSKTPSDSNVVTLSSNCVLSQNNESKCNNALTVACKSKESVKQIVKKTMSVSNINSNKNSSKNLVISDVQSSVSNVKQKNNNSAHSLGNKSEPNKVPVPTSSYSNVVSECQNISSKMGPNVSKSSTISSCSETKISTAPTSTHLLVPSVPLPSTHWSPSSRINQINRDTTTPISKSTITTSQAVTSTRKTTSSLLPSCKNSTKAVCTPISTSVASLLSANKVSVGCNSVSSTITAASSTISVTGSTRSAAGSVLSATSSTKSDPSSSISAATSSISSATSMASDAISTVSPTTSTISPVTSTVSPVTSTVSPVTSTVSPVTSTVSPVTSTVSPVNSTVSPVTSTVSPVTSTVSPVTSTVSPVTSTVSPATNTVFPATSSVSSATSTMSPATSTVSLATSTISPATSTISPATFTISPATFTVSPATSTVSLATSTVSSANSVSATTSSVSPATTYVATSASTAKSIGSVAGPHAPAQVDLPISSAAASQSHVILSTSNNASGCLSSVALPTCAAHTIASNVVASCLSTESTAASSCKPNVHSVSCSQLSTQQSVAASSQSITSSSPNVHIPPDTLSNAHKNSYNIPLYSLPYTSGTTNMNHSDSCTFPAYSCINSSQNSNSFYNNSYYSAAAIPAANVYSSTNPNLPTTSSLIDATVKCDTAKSLAVPAAISAVSNHLNNSTSVTGPKVSNAGVTKNSAQVSQLTSCMTKVSSSSGITASTPNSVGNLSQPKATITSSSFASCSKAGGEHSYTAAASDAADVCTSSASKSPIAQLGSITPALSSPSMPSPPHSYSPKLQAAQSNLPYPNVNYQCPIPNISPLALNSLSASPYNSNAPAKANTPVNQSKSTSKNKHSTGTKTPVSSKASSVQISVATVSSAPTTQTMQAISKDVSKSKAVPKSSTTTTTAKTKATTNSKASNHTSSSVDSQVLQNYQMFNSNPYALSNFMSQNGLQQNHNFLDPFSAYGFSRNLPSTSQSNNYNNFQMGSRSSDMSGYGYCFSGGKHSADTSRQFSSSTHHYNNPYFNSSQTDSNSSVSAQAAALNAYLAANYSSFNSSYAMANFPYLMSNSLPMNMMQSGWNSSFAFGKASPSPVTMANSVDSNNCSIVNNSSNSSYPGFYYNNNSGYSSNSLMSNSGCGTYNNYPYLSPFNHFTPPTSLPSQSSSKTNSSSFNSDPFSSMNFSPSFLLDKSQSKSPSRYNSSSTPNSNASASYSGSQNGAAQSVSSAAMCSQMPSSSAATTTPTSSNNLFQAPLWGNSSSSSSKSKTGSNEIQGFLAGISSTTASTSAGNTFPSLSYANSLFTGFPYQNPHSTYSSASSASNVPVSSIPCTSSFQSSLNQKNSMSYAFSSENSSSQSSNFPMTYGTQHSHTSKNSNFSKNDSSVSTMLHNRLPSDTQTTSSSSNLTANAAALYPTNRAAQSTQSNEQSSQNNNSSSVHMKASNSNAQTSHSTQSKPHK